MTKSKRVLVLVFAALLVFSLAGCRTPEKSQKILPENPNGHSYRMELRLDEKEKTVSGTLALTYRNATGKDLKEIPFFVYPNAFADKQTAPFYKSYTDTAYPNGFSPGSITFSRIAADGTEAAHILGNADKSLLTITLPRPLANGGSAQIAFDFTVQIPNSLGRFGYGSKAINLCNFYPIACPYDGTKFLTYPYIEQGDPFVSDMADYEVTLEVPNGLIVAHTGSSTQKSEGKTDIYTITAKSVRDFAAVCSRHFQMKSERIVKDGTDVMVTAYTYDDASFGKSEALDYGANAIKAFSNLIGPYPYATMCVVQTDFFIGGMEYPNIVLIDQSLYERESKTMLEFIIAHEVGHQWFYGVVGNDQVMEPWLDEALTDYITLCYYGYRYGKDAQLEQYKQQIELQYQFGKAYGLIPEEFDRVGLPTTSFEDDFVYSVVVYNRGTMMFTELANTIGKEKLLKALGVYYREMAGKRSTKADLLRVLDRETGFDCSGFMAKYL